MENFVTHSHPYQFGDLSIGNETFSNYLGTVNGIIAEEWI